MASFNRVTMSGSTNLLAVTFPYLNKSHVQVYLNDVLQDPSTYTWPTDAIIAITAGPPAAGTIGEARRTTPVTPLVTFQSGPLDTSDLNTATLQSLHVAEEASDVADGAETTAVGVDAKAQSALDATTAHSARTDNPHTVTKAQVGLGSVDNVSAANLRDRSTHTGTQAVATVTGLQAELNGKINATEKGAAGGVATLDVGGRVPSAQLPAYVDDVIEYASTLSFPVTGESGIIYVAQDTGRTYRWSGSAYTEMVASPGTTDDVVEGTTNLYHTASRVLGVVLSGLSLASTVAVAATDTVLVALGKLQAQITLYKDRANQVGTQTASTISDLSEAVDDRVASFLVAGTNVTLTHDDAGNTLTVNATGTVSTAATAIVVTASGNISSTNAQAALQELDTEKVAKAGDTMTGNLTVQKAAPGVNLRRAADTERSLLGFFGTTGLANWYAGQLSSADTKPNGWALLRRDPATGSAIDNPITVDPLTGEVALGTATQFASAPGGFKWTVAITAAVSANMDTLVEGGTYRVESPTNGPIAMAAATHAYVEVIAFSSTYVIQRWMLVLSGTTRPAVWLRKMVAGVWGSWSPDTGFVTPAHFGARPSLSPDLATVPYNGALASWWQSPYPKLLDGWYMASATTITRTLVAADSGFYLEGCGAQSGLRLDSGARFEIAGGDLSNPHGMKNDTVTIKDLLFCVNSVVTSALSVSFVAGDIGSSMPALHMSNVHFLPANAASGPSDAMLLLTNVRQRHLENVSAIGQYGAYTGAFIKDVIGDSSAPVECVHVNCRAAHFGTGFLLLPSDAAPTNDDAQGYHYHSCTAIAVNRGWDVSGGPEGFGEWFTLTSCHAYFREVGVITLNAGNIRITDGYWLAHGALATCQGIAITGTVSIEPYLAIKDNRIRLDAASGATRIGINIPAGTPFVGSARYNRTTGATTAYSIVAGVTSVGNV